MLKRSGTLTTGAAAWRSTVVAMPPVYCESPTPSRLVSSMSRRNTSKNMEVGNGLSWRGSRGSTAVLVVDPSRPGTEEGGARSGVERLDREGVVSASWRGDPCLCHSTNERAILVGGGTD